MTAEGNAVQDRLGDTSDHAMTPGPAPGPRASTPFLYASGAQPLGGYTIKRGVGTGGFGEVYYAVSDAGKDVALKLVRRNLDTELRGMRQCLNLKHPNLLGLFDIRVDDTGDTWIVMEYIAGKSLEAELADHPQGLPVEDALAWFRGMAAGVAYLHDHGIVHRDLKPGNIFCDEGIVKVGDYGLSKFISCSRRSGHTESIGTVHYMAPEVAHGRYGKELDIYALGAVLFELLTGRVPFDGESVGEVLMKHLTAVPDVSCLAEPYRSVVARALEKDPARRFATVGEMLAALECGDSSPLSGRFAAFPKSGQSPQDKAGVNPRTPYDKAGINPRTPNTAIPVAIPVARPVPARVPAEIAEDPNQEPIARAVRQGLAQLRHSWRTADLPPLLKALIVVGSIILMAALSPWLIGPAVAVTMLYVGYRIVRWFYLLAFGPPRARPAFRGTRAPGERPSPVFVVKPRLERLRELIGSLLIAAAVTGAMCVVMVLIAAHSNSSFVRPEQCAWLFLVSLAGAWVVLVAGKFWEGSDGEPLLRRFILMTFGLGLGMAAFAAAEAFHVRLPVETSLSMRTGLQLPPSFYSDGRPLAMAYMAVFATLLALVRWWRQCDPLRTARLSLATIIVSVIGAHIVALGWQFPEPWLMMAAGCISVSVQLASPWVPAYARLRPQRKKVI